MLINAIILDENSTFHEAAKEGSLEIIKYLGEQLPSLKEDLTYSDYGLFSIAATGGYLEEVKSLLEKKEVRKRIIEYIELGGNTPSLSDAAIGGHLDIVELLLKVPEIAAHAHDMMNAPLRSAIQGGNLDVVNALLKQPMVEETVAAEGNKVLKEALQWSKNNDNFEIIKRLLSIKSVADNIDREVMLEAMFSVNPEVTKLFLDTPFFRNEDPIYAPQYLWGLVNKTGNMEILELLLKKRGFPEHVAGYEPQNAILFQAARYGRFEMVKRLLEIYCSAIFTF